MESRKTSSKFKHQSYLWILVELWLIKYVYCLTIVHQQHKLFLNNDTFCAKKVKMTQKPVLDMCYLCLHFWLRYIRMWVVIRSQARVMPVMRSRERWFRWVARYVIEARSGYYVCVKIKVRRPFADNNDAMFSPRTLVAIFHQLRQGRLYRHVIPMATAACSLGQIKQKSWRQSISYIRNYVAKSWVNFKLNDCTCICGGNGWTTAVNVFNKMLNKIRYVDQSFLRSWP